MIEYVVIFFLNQFQTIYPSAVVKYRLQKIHLMMTSSNGNIFRVTGPLCGEFTGHRWIPRTKASDAELWCFLWSAPWINGWANNREAGDLRRQCVHYDVIVMFQWESKYQCMWIYGQCVNLATLDLQQLRWIGCPTLHWHSNTGVKWTPWSTHWATHCLHFTLLLSNWGFVMPYGDLDLGQHWLSQWLVAWQHQAII